MLQNELFCTGSKSWIDCQRRQTSVMFISKWQAKYWQMFNFELVFSVMNSVSSIIFPFVFKKNHKALLTTPWGRVTLIYLSKLTLYYHWFGQWFVVLWWQVINWTRDCWLIINWILRSKLQLNFNQNTIFIQENEYVSMDVDSIPEFKYIFSMDLNTGIHHHIHPNVHMLIIYGHILYYKVPKLRCWHVAWNLF